MDRECNDYVAGLTGQYPDRFSGLANLPMQDMAASVAELERSVKNLGLKGAMIGDNVNGKTYDNPEFFPLWEAAEQLGAVMLIHQDGPTVVSPRNNNYHLSNTIGNLADRAVTFASFVFGGVMDKFPNLRVCLLDFEPGKPDPGGEGSHPLEKP
jgi:aminocarboxymuconate-semialdehyde decarboxylase